jgi:cytosine/adenosine deaminase-related metal-dependent hydrolase
MLLRNLSIVGTEGPKDILIENGKIAAVVDSAKSPTSIPTVMSIPFREAIAFPGLINSHDHLDFNLFPQLGNKVYTNYREWGRDIQENNKMEIKTVLKIPLLLRTKWGIYKNLLNGVTTVVNHGEWLFIGEGEELIAVLQDCYSLHSVVFEENWKWKLNRPFLGSKIIVIHVGEGTDESANREIDQLLAWNLFKRPLIAIHGVAMNEIQAPGFRALIWCPASNYFLLNQTAPVDLLKKKLPVLFGTDSTLTAGWNIWEQIRLARKEGLMTDQELLDALTIAPAKAWGLKDCGKIAAGWVADLVIARPKENLCGLDAFFGLDPEDILLVISKGKIRLFDPSLLKNLVDSGFELEHFHQAGSGGKFTQGDLPGLINGIRTYYPAVSMPMGLG